MRKIYYILIIVLLSSIISENYAQNNYYGKLGYGFSPEGQPYDYDSIAPFLQEVANTCDGGVVFANSNWRDSINSSGLIPGLQKLVCLAQPMPYGYADMINFAWASYPTLYLDVPGDATNNWTNVTAKNLFLQMLINAADSLKPTYFFIGNEISTYWAQDSADYINWMSFYNQAYDSIKVHSPSSKVGTTFNYEHLTGNGTFVGFTTPYWNAFNALDTSKIDILGLTVYPFFKYPHANSVPANYLEPIFNRMGNKPIAITETGWPGDSVIGAWYASSAEQVDYVNTLFSMISGKNVEVVNWLFLNYLMDTSNTAEMLLFKSVALRDSLGNDRPALPIWLSYCDNATRIENTTAMQQTDVIVYPNPFSSTTTIEIKYNMQNASLVVYNLFGEIVAYLNNLNGNIIKVDRNNLSHGVYFFQVTENDKIFAGKLIIE
ncbi:MAG: T9SS type A sorting domain-containing protein [Bacteroidetes bacterium]|nr:T9SS type A sorting domain-containing protein [Bacteroidota bacterium]